MAFRIGLHDLSLISGGREQRRVCTWTQSALSSSPEIPPMQLSMKFASKEQRRISTCCSYMRTWTQHQEQGFQDRNLAKGTSSSGKQIAKTWFMTFFIYYYPPQRDIASRTLVCSESTELLLSDDRLGPSYSRAPSVSDHTDRSSR